MKIAQRKNCRIEYVNKYSVLVDFSGSNDVIVYYEFGVKTLKDLYANYKYRKDNEMDLDLYPFPFFMYPVQK